MKITDELFEQILRNMNEKKDEIYKKTQGKENIDTLALTGIYSGISGLKKIWKSATSSVNLDALKCKFEVQLGERRGVIGGRISAELHQFLVGYMKENLSLPTDEKALQIEAKHATCGIQ